MGTLHTSDPARAMRRALADGALEIERQLGRAQDEAQRLQALLDDAIGSLIASFDALDGLAQRQCATSAAAPDGALAAFTAELRRHVAAASGALQFHDIASQLGGHACRHIERARQLTGGLQALAAAPAATAAPVSTLPGDVVASARAPHWHPLSGMVGEAQRNTQSSPVTHARVAAGEAELF